MENKQEKEKNEKVEEKENSKDVKDKKEDTENKLKEELTNTKAQLDDVTDRYKRILAEFENFKKRSLKEREGLYNSVLADIVNSLLPVLDNLENACNAESKDENYKKGVELVLKQFKDVLTSVGVQEIETVGTIFNPEYHEAVSSVQDESLGEKEIKEVYRKGYKIGDRVIRHAMVVVAN